MKKSVLIIFFVLVTLIPLSARAEFTFKDMVELLILVGSIPADKADFAREAVLNRAIIYQNPKSNGLTSSGIQFKWIDSDRCLKEGYGEADAYYEVSLGTFGYRGKAKNMKLKFSLDTDSAGGSIKMDDLVYDDFHKGYQEYQTRPRTIDTPVGFHEFNVKLKHVKNGDTVSFSVMSATTTDSAQIKGLPLEVRKTLVKCKSL